MARPGRRGHAGSGVTGLDKVGRHGVARLGEAWCGRHGWVATARKAVVTSLSAAGSAQRCIYSCRYRPDYCARRSRR